MVNNVINFLNFIKKYGLLDQNIEVNELGFKSIYAYNVSVSDIFIRIYEILQMLIKCIPYQTIYGYL